MGLLPASRPTVYSTSAVRSAGRSAGSVPGGLRRWGWLGVVLLVLVGLGLSLLLSTQPLYAAALVIAAGGLFVFLRNFEQTVLGILLMRSVLDMYSNQGVPAAFGVGVILLAIVYLGRQLIFRQRVHTDPFWWFLLSWVLLQSIWVVVLAADGLGGTQFMAYEAAREWTRFFSLAMIYLLAMQLRDHIAPDRLANFLLLSAAIPLALAILQSLPIELPGFLQSNVAWTEYESEAFRINSTLGHYNSFATFSLLFLALTLWRIQMARKPLGWILLAAGLLYCLLLSKSITGIVMLVVFCAVYFLPKLRGKGLAGAIAVSIALLFLLSSDLAQSRLLELNQTPLLNPDLSVSRAIALQAADMDEFRNSFNWRLVQWRNLLIDWQEHPLLGYGLASAKELSVFNTTSHNDYIRFLVEEGVIGLSLFLLFLMAQLTRLVQIMRRSAPNSPQRALSQTMLAFMISMLVGMLAGNVMVHTATFFYWWVLMALLGWSWPAEFGGSVPRTLSGSSQHSGGLDSTEIDSTELTESSRWAEQSSVPITAQSSDLDPSTPDFYTESGPYNDVDRYNRFNAANFQNSIGSEQASFHSDDVQAESGDYDSDYRLDAYSVDFDEMSAFNPADLYVYRPTDTYLTETRLSDSYPDNASALDDLNLKDS